MTEHYRSLIRPLTYLTLCEELALHPLLVDERGDYPNFRDPLRYILHVAEDLVPTANGILASAGQVDTCNSNIQPLHMCSVAVRKQRALPAGAWRLDLDPRSMAVRCPGCGADHCIECCQAGRDGAWRNKSTN